MVGIPEKRWGGGFAFFEVGGLVTEEGTAIGDEMKGATRNVVSLLVGGEDGAVLAETDEGETESVGKNGSGLAIWSDVDDGATIGGVLVFELCFFRFEDAAFGNQEGPVGPDSEGGGVVAGVECLKVGVGGITEFIDEAVAVDIDELGDLVASEGEEAIFGIHFDGHGFEESGCDAGPARLGLGDVLDLPNIAIEGGEVSVAIFCGKQCR